MKIIQLSQHQITQVSDTDYFYLSRFSWSANKVARKFGKDIYYATGRVNGFRKRMNRVVAARMGLSLDYLIDHKDGDTLNNMRSNLREATSIQNGQNRTGKPSAVSNTRGVYRSRERWRAQIRVDTKLISLGSFDTIEEAARFRRQAEKKYFGKFAPKGGI